MNKRPLHDFPAAPVRLSLPTRLMTFLATALVGATTSLSGQAADPAAILPSTPLWDLARANVEAHRISTLFTAQDVRDQLATDEGFQHALKWCRDTGLTKVYLETFRDGYEADAAVLARARDQFRAAGLEVAGCITTTGVGKPSSGWKVVACYTDLPTQERIRTLFARAAGLFDELMIDDFWFTDCECPQCDAARQARRVRVADATIAVLGDTWQDYRRALLLELSRTQVIAPARLANPQVRLIIKYPQWYDRFQDRGYDVRRETELFDRIWVGTETRDYNDRQWGGTVQYEACFIMRWLGGIGGAKCGGGWYDWLGTTEATYIEQARQTVLGGAREALLFCYGGLQRDTGPKNIAAFRAQLPELLAVAREVQQRAPVGLAAYKPANSSPGSEARVFDFVGVLGLPLLPCHAFPTEAPAVFLSLHALKDPGLEPALRAFVAKGRPVLLTDGLRQQIGSAPWLEVPNVHILPVGGDPQSLRKLAQADLDALRAALLGPFQTRLEAPNGVALYLFADGSRVLENFNDQEARVALDARTLAIPARGWWLDWRPRPSAP